MFTFLANMSAKAKAFVDWLDRIPGVGAFGVGIGVGMLWPLPTLTTLLLALGVYVVLKLDLGNLGTKLSGLLK